MIQTFTLSPGVTLRCFPDSRFKQSRLSIQFVRQMCREEAALNALLPAVLLRGSKNCQDLRAITLKLDDLYGAAVGAVVRRIGDYQTTGLSCSFIEDRYALQGDAIFTPMVAFLQELLLEPVLENGAFREDFVSSERKNLISTIEAQRNDKRFYATSRMNRLLCQNDSFGIPRLGEIEQAQAITPRNLYDHYLRVLRESPVEIFYVGSAAPEQVAQILKPVFEGMDRSYVNLPEQTGFHPAPFTEEIEVMDVTQGRLCMGFTSPITLRHEDFAAMQVFNTLFGGGMTSKLFMELREQQSLCYDIGSSYHGSKGIVTLTAGIDSCQYDHARQQIMEQLRLCREGVISEAELTAAKQAIISQLLTTHDSPGSIEGYYATAALSGLTITPDEYLQAVEAVTKEDAARAAKGLQLQTVYFLKGETV